MQKIRIIVVVVAVSLMASLSFAENESFIQRLKKRFTATQDEKKKAETPKSIEQAKPVESAKPDEAIVETKTPQPTVVQKDVKDMTKEELVKEITRMYTNYRNIAVTGMEAETDDKGAVTAIYYNKGDGSRVRIDDLDKETLESLFVNVRREMVRISTERTMKMMEDIRRIQEMNRQQRELSRTIQQKGVPGATYKPPSAPPALPKTYTPPKLPPSVPKTPKTTTR